MKNIFEFLLIFFMLLAVAWCMKTPDWSTVDMRKHPASSGIAWNVAREYKPEGMHMWDYVDRLRQANPGGWQQGEAIWIPVCEVQREKGESQ